MKFFDLFKPERALSETQGVQETAPVKEHASSGYVDQDEFMFRRLNSGREYDKHITEAEMKRQRVIAHNLYRAHPLGSIPDMLVDKALGSALQFKAEDEKVQAVVDRFVQDPDTDLEQYLPIYVRERLLFGDLFLPLAFTPENGDVRLGYLSPDDVEEVIFSRADRKRPVAVLQRRPSFTEKRLLWIIPHPEVEYDGFAPHPALDEEGDTQHVGLDGHPVRLPAGADGALLAQKVRQGTQVAGYLFYHRSNHLAVGRGRSLFERVADWMKASDDFLFGTLRNAILQGSILYKITIKDADEVACKKRRAEIGGTPRPGTVLVTNDTETWEAMSPKVTPASQIKELTSTVLKLIGTAVGLPAHEVGAEDDVNRSTAAEARSVSVVRAKRLQKETAAMVNTWLQYVIAQKVFRGQLPEDVDRKVECVFPEADARDESETATALKTLAEGLQTALDAKLMTKKDARTLIYSTAGLDLPDESEFAALDAEDDQPPVQALPPVVNVQAPRGAAAAEAFRKLVSGRR